MSKEFTVTLKNAQSVLNSLWGFIVESLAGGPVTVSVSRPSRSRAQEKHYHALIGEIAKQVSVMGKRYNPEIWKVLLVDQFAQEKKSMGEQLSNPGATVPAMDMSGRLVTIRPSTRKFNKKEGQEFIEYLYSKGIEMGVKWSASAQQIKMAEGLKCS